MLKQISNPNMPYRVIEVPKITSKTTNNPAAITDPGIE